MLGSEVLQVLELSSRLCVPPFGLHANKPADLCVCECAGVCACTNNPISAFHTLPRLEAKPCNVVAPKPEWGLSFSCI